MEALHRKKRILIAMIEVGGCHKSIALAIKDAVEILWPDTYEIVVADLPRACGASKVDKFIKSVWNAALASPVITTQLNVWMDEVGELARSNTFLKVFFTEFVIKGMKYIKEFSPDIVVSTHFFCTSVAAFTRKKYALNFRVLSHVSDPFRTHSLWVNPLADEFAVSSIAARDHLASLGQSKDFMKIFPFPIHHRFFEPLSRSRTEILEQLGLDPHRSTVFASSGGEGIGDTERFVREIYFSMHNINLIVVCGRNENLLREMQLLSARPSKVLIAPLGFVTNMNELVSVSDVAIVKAGPSTLFELLSKGCPVMVTHVAARIEQGNLDFITENGFGWDVRDPEIFTQVLAQLSKPDFLLPFRERIRSSEYIQSLNGASFLLARWLVNDLETNRAAADIDQDESVARTAVRKREKFKPKIAEKFISKKKADSDSF